MDGGVVNNLPALHDYARATARTILSWVTSLAPEDLDRTIPAPLGDHNLGQFLQIFIICHINNHIGEVSALRGYPW